MDKKLLKSLIKMNESITLDFKRDFYKFTQGADKERRKIEDSNFIKDIVAFNNTIRTQVSYIIIGVDDTKTTFEDRCVGISSLTEIPDEATLQQKVNSKIEPTIFFSIDNYDIDGKLIIVISIPIPSQSTPSFLKTELTNRLRKGELYFRAGSSTKEANAEEKRQIFRWFEDLKYGYRKRKSTESALTKLIRESQADLGLSWKAEPLIKKMAKDIGLSEDELKYLIAKEKKNKDKRKIGFNTAIPILMMLFFIIGLFFIVRSCNKTDKSGFSVENRGVIDSLIQRRNFSEARIVSSKMRPSLLANAKTFEMYITEKQIDYYLKNGYIDSSLLILKFNHSMNPLNVIHNTSSQNLNRTIDSYNYKAKWYNDAVIKILQVSEVLNLNSEIDHTKNILPRIESIGWDSVYLDSSLIKSLEK